jgi:transposase
MLMSPSLDDMVPDGHRVRRFEQILLKADWSEWEAQYGGPRGRPPIHPRIMAGAIIYGLTERIRSSRDLEKATNMRVDFMWLVERRTIDHSTFADFKTRFEKQLPKLFKELALIALGDNREIELAIDGTRIRSNSSRTGALTAKAIEKRAKKIADDLSQALEEMEQVDALDDPSGCSAEDIEKRISTLKIQEEKLARALKEARSRDEAKARKGDKRWAQSSRVPVTDPDSHSLQNKEGGYAPNYTPTAAVDTSSGVIVAADVPEGSDEASSVSKAVSATTELTGKLPERVLFDSSFATGSNLKELSGGRVETYSSAGFLGSNNPAIRPDPSIPVLPEDWDNLPTQGKKTPRFTREAFIYDHEQDCYWCPMGHQLPFLRNQKRMTGNITVKIREYMCKNCTECPLAKSCLSRNAKQRRVIRDEFEPHRERLRQRMNCDQGREVYSRRAPAAEGVFARIKHVMGIRQFLLRGAEKVRTEWLWICTACNVSKILNSI